MTRSAPRSRSIHTILRLSIVVLFFHVIADLAYSQATVTTQDGLVFRGRILHKGLDSLRMLTVDSQLVMLSNLQVRTIDEPEVRDRIHAIELPPPPRDPVCADCLMFGASFGEVFGAQNSGASNVTLIAGFRASAVGVRLSGSAYKYRNKGYELDFLANLDWKEGFSHDIYIGMGIVGDAPGQLRRWRYTVIGYNLNVVGIYANIGIGFGSSIVANPQIMTQIGYVREIP
jgi:hypothetical protein